ncbi:hypothetical protein V2J09_007188 [Rumex salicifolius]
MTTNAEEASRLLMKQLAQIAQNQGHSQGDPLSLANSDCPGTTITTVPFDGKNFFIWSRQVRLGLKTKTNLVSWMDQFQNQKTSPDFFLWSRADEMVAYWLLNSMTPELSGTFVYSGTVKDLWCEIMERYCQTNAPMVYQLKLEVLRTTQGNSFVTTYYSKLKHSWEELRFMNEIPTCTCGTLLKCECKVIDRVLELESQDKLMQFLANLNPEYESVKSQILAIDPLPSMNKAYYLKEIGSLAPESTTFMTRSGGSRKYNEKSLSNDKRDSGKPKENEKKLYSQCNKTGHIVEDCFEVIGFLDWYKGKKKTRQFSVSNQVGSQSGQGQMSSALDGEGSSATGKHSSFDPEFVQAMCNEMMKVFKGKMPSVSNYAGSSSRAEVSGNVLHDRLGHLSYSTLEYVLGEQTAKDEARTAPFPLPSGLKLSVEDGELVTDSEQYRRLLCKARHQLCSPTPVSICFTTKTTTFTSRIAPFENKAFELDCHFTREKVQSDFLQTTYIHTSLQLVDVITMTLGRARHDFLTRKLGFLSVPN